MGPIETLTNELAECWEVGATPALEGDVGVGKTALVKAVARRLGAEIYVMIVSQIDPVLDLSGAPVVMPVEYTDRHGNKYPVTQFALPDWVKKLAAAERAVVFVDEATTATVTVQAAFLTMLTDGRVGNFHFDRSRIWFVMAYNPPDMAPNGTELMPPMLNRLTHFTFPMTPEVVAEWCASFVPYWGAPPKIGRPGREIPEAMMLRARAAWAGYIKRVPAHWHVNYAPAAAKKKTKSDQVAADLEVKAYPTPRSLDRASWHYGRCLYRGVNPIEGARLYAAEVGDGVAQQFVAWVREADLPDPEALLADPDSYTPSGRPDLDFATLTAVASAFDARPEPPRYTAAWQILRRAVDVRGEGGTRAYEAGAAAATQLGRWLNPTNQPVLVKGLGSGKEVGKWLATVIKAAEPYHSLFAKMGVSL